MKQDWNRYLTPAKPEEVDALYREVMGEEMRRIEVAQIDVKSWGLYVNGILIGTSKARFDADHAKVMLEKALASSVSEQKENLKI